MGPQTLNGITPWYIFDNAGIFNITLSVTDDAGKWHTDNMTVTVNDITDPVANAGQDRSVDQHENLTLNGSLSYDNVGLVDCSWSFDDGGLQTLNGITPWYVFDNAGTFNITLNVTDDAGKWHTDNMTVTVNDITDPVANAGDDIAIDQGDTTTFNGSPSIDNVGIVNYTWNFTYGGSAYTLYGKTAAFTFNISGRYNITLTITDDAGNSAKDTLIVRVIEIPAVVVTGLTLGPFKWSDEKPMIGVTVTLDGGTRTIHTSETDEDGLAKFTGLVKFGDYTYKVTKTVNNRTVAILEGVMTIDASTLNNEAWLPSENKEKATYDYTEDEFDEMVGFKPTEPSETNTFLPDVEVEVSIPETDEKVNVKVSKPVDNTVKVDIGVKKNLSLKMGEPMEIDSDGDGRDDLEATYVGNDANGNPIVTFNAISAEERPSEYTFIIVIASIVVLVVVILHIFFLRKKKPKKGEETTEGSMVQEISATTEMDEDGLVCPKCGLEMDDGGEICQNCGAPLVETEEDDEKEEGEDEEEDEEEWFGDSPDDKEICPECWEDIGKEEDVCPHCGFFIIEAADVDDEEEDWDDEEDEFDDLDDMLADVQGIDLDWDDKTELSGFYEDDEDKEDEDDYEDDEREDEEGEDIELEDNERSELEEEPGVPGGADLDETEAEGEGEDEDPIDFTPVGDEEDYEIEFQCPRCDNLVSERSDFCPNCGIGFMAEESTMDQFSPDQGIHDDEGRYVEPDFDFDFCEDECETEYRCLFCDAMITEAKPLCPHCGVQYESKEDSKLDKSLLAGEALEKKGRYTKSEDDAV